MSTCGFFRMSAASVVSVLADSKVMVSRGHAGCRNHGFFTGKARLRPPWHATWSRFSYSLPVSLSCRAVLSEGRLRVVPGVVVVHRETHAISRFGHMAECRFMLAQFASCGRGTSGLCFVPSCFVALQSARSEWRLPEDLGFPT